jgi:hypothetical protein
VACEFCSALRLLSQLLSTLFSVKIKQHTAHEIGLPCRTPEEQSTILLPSRKVVHILRVVVLADVECAKLFDNSKARSGLDQDM